MEDHNTKIKGFHAHVYFDPATREGMPVTRVVGVLRPVNIGTFNVWIMYPRTGADLTL